jgi:hypothetical protein
MICGLDKAAVARAEGTDEAAIDTLLTQDGFAEVIAGWQDILDEGSPEFMARLENLCRSALTSALAEWDVGAALSAQRELGQGRDPALTLARRVRARAKRTPAPAFARAAEPPIPWLAFIPGPDPLDALIQRSAAGLRQAVVLEHAIRASAQTADDETPMVAAAGKALALRRVRHTTSPRPIALRDGMHGSGATAVPVSSSIVAGPRRTREP